MEVSAGVRLIERSKATANTGRVPVISTVSNPNGTVESIVFVRVKAGTKAVHADYRWHFGCSRRLVRWSRPGSFVLGYPLYFSLFRY